MKELNSPSVESVAKKLIEVSMMFREKLNKSVFESHTRKVRSTNHELELQVGDRDIVAWGATKPRDYALEISVRYGVTEVTPAGKHEETSHECELVTESKVDFPNQGNVDEQVCPIPEAMEATEHSGLYFNYEVE